MSGNNIYRWLPAVDELLAHEKLLEYQAVPRTLVVESIRTVLVRFRQKLHEEKDKYENADMLKNAVIEDVIKLIGKKIQPALRSVINATGVVLHTNLGRAVLSEGARRAVDMVVSGYSNLELNLETGVRGSRYSHVEELLLKLTGAEACLVVNNNASAVLLALDTLAKGKESIVSRGQLVEIGGAFRVPEVMERSGSKLVEVGTTNKTYAVDYENALAEETGLLLKVHTSNYRVTGFTHEATLSEMVELGNKYQIPVMDDLGSGCLFDLKSYGVGDEPTVQQVVDSGVDIVTVSGDKLLGGPQAGIIVGKEKYISLMKKNPLNRALRIDKMTIAALEATLRSYLDMEKAVREIPVLEMLTRSLDVLKEQAEKLERMLVDELKDYLEIKLEKGLSRPGGGSLPTTELETWLVMIKPKNKSVDNFASRLRNGNPAVLAYVRNECIVMDVRTILSSEYGLLLQAIKKACGGI